MEAARLVLRNPHLKSEMWGNHFMACSKVKCVPSSAGALL
jgi:hypothetical protein